MQGVCHFARPICTAHQWSEFASCFLPYILGAELARITLLQLRLNSPLLSLALWRGVVEECGYHAEI